MTRRGALCELLHARSSHGTVKFALRRIGAEARGLKPS